ncbi:MAG: YCF48-related protein, partial [Colwellia sp.]
EGATRPFLDLWFKNENEGFIVGGFGLILHTLDGGDKWTPWFEHIKNLDLFSFNAITHINGQLFIAAEAGNLYRSDDNGQQWTLLTSPYEGSFFGINSIGKTGVIAFGLRGNAYVSADKGESWVKVDTGVEASLFASTQLDNGSSVVVGAGGVMLFIDANGKLLNTKHHPRKFPISAIITGENDNLLTVGFGGIQKVERLTATAEQSHD